MNDPLRVDLGQSRKDLALLFGERSKRGIIAAAPAPWTNLAAMRISIPGAMPQVSAAGWRRC